MTSGTFATHFHTLPDGRRLAYSDTPGAPADDVLLCLPGLLETRATFDPLLHAAQAHPGLRVVSLDLCGRGDADPLAGDQGYTMARYLEDLRHFIDTQGMAQPGLRLHLLGTSMGGILAMYLASDKALPVRTLLLNDIGLTFYWVSIYGLYDTMKKGVRSADPEAIAAELHVTQGVLLGVQSPSHFDLPYKRDWKGMKFGQLLDGYRGAVRLVHGADSGVCLAEQVREMQQRFAKLRVCEVPGAGHPAPFNAEVCDFVLADLASAGVAVEAAPMRETAQSPDAAPVRALAQTPEAVRKPEDAPVSAPASAQTSDEGIQMALPFNGSSASAAASEASTSPSPQPGQPPLPRTVDVPTYKRLLWSWFRRKPDER